MLMKALAALMPATALLAWSAAAFIRSRTAGLGLQLLGAACLVLVVLTHVAEALEVFPSMAWGEPHSAGHYVDLASAVLGLTLLPFGHILHRVAERKSRRRDVPSG
jgi:hypothetical protein